MAKQRRRRGRPAGNVSDVGPIKKGKKCQARPEVVKVNRSAESDFLHRWLFPKMGPHRSTQQP